MKHKWILITLSIIFFITALTLYANRVIFPKVIKKIAIEQAEAFLKRKVEIEDIRFSWVNGVIIKKIKVYQKDSTTDVLAQAQKISMGIIFIPGFKQHGLTIPSVNIQELSMHLIHQADNQWNFSDLLVPPKSDGKPSPLAVSVGGINITNAKIRLDDVQPQSLWTELFDQVNLKVGLSFGGISFDGSLLIPNKEGAISLNGTYQPLSQALKASVNLKNIKPLDYLGLVPMQLPMTLSSGTIDHVNAQVQYSSNHIEVQGDWSFKNIDMTVAEHTIKTDVDVTSAQISLKDNLTAVKGKFSFTNTQILTPTLSMKGSLKADVDDFHMNSIDDITIKTSLQGDGLNIQLPNDQSFQGQLVAQITQGRWQKDSATIEGNIALNQALIALSDDQNIKGDLKLTGIKLSKDKKTTSASVNVGINNMDVRMPGKIFKGNLTTPLSISLDEQNNLQATGSIDLDNADILMDKTSAKGSIHLNTFKLNFNQTQQIIDTKIQGVLQKISISLDEGKTFSMNAHLDLHATYPLRNPAGLDYSGSVAVEGARLEGIPFGPVTNINLTADIKTDTANIQSLTLSILDTPIQISGQVINFTKPILNMQVSAGLIDLSKAKEVAPDLLKTYGLLVDGQITSLKIKYEGMALDPSSAKINGEGILKNVSVESTTMKQSLKNVSGSIKATGDSIAWEDFSGEYMGKTFVLTGRLDDLKNPKIVTSLTSDVIGLNARINKNKDLLEIINVSGHYLSVDFQTQGTVDLSSKIPVLDLKNAVTFKLEDLSTFLPDLKKTLDPLKLSGLLNVNATIKGTASDWQNWTSVVNVQSDAIEAMGLKFTHVALKANQSEGKVQTCNITSDAYQGTISIISDIDLMNKDFPADVGVKIINLDVASILKDLKVPQDIRGKFNLTSTFKLGLMQPLDVAGKGSLSILEAYLADIELFKGILSPLRAIVPTSNLILNEVTGNFSVADQKVNTNDLQLKGNMMNLVGKGWVGFDQTLEMSIEVPDEYNQESALPPEIRQSIHYTIRGQLSKPKIEHHFSEIKTIINVGKKILGDKLPQGVSDILNSLPF